MTVRRFLLSSVPAGHGLDNLQSRLGTLFSADASLQVDGGEQGKTVRMTVPVAGAKKIA